MYAVCAKVCADCMVVCEGMAHHCGELVAAGKKEHVKPMQLAVDRAEFCALAGKLTARHSDLSLAACDACAAACDKFPDMPEMKACAAKCRECGKACREMVKMGGHAGHEKK